MISYSINTTAISYPHQNPGYLWMVQTHWQSTAGSITLGTLHRSSILIDEEKSHVNEWVAESINSKLFEQINIVEVDNVCDHGMDIYKALTTYNENYVSTTGKKN